MSFHHHIVITNEPQRNNAGLLRIGLSKPHKFPPTNRRLTALELAYLKLVKLTVLFKDHSDETDAEFSKLYQPLLRTFYIDVVMASEFLEAGGFATLAAEVVAFHTQAVWLAMYVDLLEWIQNGAASAASSICQTDLSPEARCHIRDRLERNLMLLMRLLMSITMQDNRIGGCHVSEFDGWAVTDDVELTLANGKKYRTMVELPIWEREMRFEEYRESTIKDSPFFHKQVRAFTFATFDDIHGDAFKHLLASVKNLQKAVVPLHFPEQTEIVKEKRKVDTVPPMLAKTQPAPSNTRRQSVLDTASDHFCKAYAHVMLSDPDSVVQRQFAPLYQPLHDLVKSTVQMAAAFRDANGVRALFEEVGCPDYIVWAAMYLDSVSAVCVRLNEAAACMLQGNLAQEKRVSHCNQLEIAVLRLFRLLIAVRFNSQGSGLSLARFVKWTPSQKCTVYAPSTKAFFKTDSELPLLEHHIKWEEYRNSVIKSAPSFAPALQSVPYSEWGLGTMPSGTFQMKKDAERLIIAHADQLHFPEMVVPIVSNDNMVAQESISEDSLKPVSVDKMSVDAPKSSVVPAAEVKVGHECVICLDRPRALAPANCGHYCKCIECGAITCPVCQAPSPVWKRIFIS